MTICFKKVAKWDNRSDRELRLRLQKNRVEMPYIYHSSLHGMAGGEEDSVKRGVIWVPLVRFKFASNLTREEG